MDNKKVLGSLGENVATLYLQRQGYQIRDRNWRFEHLEIDLVAYKDGLTVFCEVKFRRASDLAATALSRAQTRNLKHAISCYCYAHLISPEKTRLDFLAVEPVGKNHFRIRRIERVY